MANSATYRHVQGIDDLTGALRQLSDEMRNTILAEGVRGAIAPILVAAKRYAKRSEQTGALRESLTTKVKNYPGSGKCVGLVGPDRAYYRRGKRASKLGALFADRRPANYAHLVEFGHVMVAPKKGTSRRRKTAIELKDSTGATRFVPPKPFIRPAVMTTKSAQAAGFYAGIARGYEKATKKLTRGLKAA